MVLINKIRLVIIKKERYSKHQEYKYNNIKILICGQKKLRIIDQFLLSIVQQLIGSNSKDNYNREKEKLIENNSIRKQGGDWINELQNINIENNIYQCNEIINSLQQQLASQMKQQKRLILQKQSKIQYLVFMQLKYHQQLCIITYKELLNIHIVVKNVLLLLQFIWISYKRNILNQYLIQNAFIDDDYYKNEYYAKVGGISVKEIFILEQTFLELMDFKLFIEENNYFMYEKKLLEFGEIEMS
ncbi:unnamed protein product [Paramecium sonneborni]|uniref:Uncharacterized protein n=1 Tax=Paramecium sonneborni TaxID=65129 RepID=A0A8S1LKX1_9CILI|nr:unnamed protein product [Paramecium sonneborni]